ncbi:hypothetical protein A2U01_0039269, partial [Trifolium medium]|nr:hypothetical protein [Trifolium medium]
IQKYMSCKGACLASVGTDQPAEVVYDAPKYLKHYELVPLISKLRVGGGVRLVIKKL